MDSNKVQKIISYAIKTLFVLLGLLMLASVVSIEGNKKPEAERTKILEAQENMHKMLAQGLIKNEKLPDNWPPQMNKIYPKMGLLDQNSTEFDLSSLKGRVVILEYIDISSPISQAQSGANVAGVFRRSGLSAQDIDKYARPFAEAIRKESGSGITLPNENIVELKILIYGEGGSQATRDDAQDWANHFNYSRENNVIVAVPKKDMRGKDIDAMIAGFQLLDRNLLLRVDSAGPSPKHNLKMTLIPLVSKLTK